MLGLRLDEPLRLDGSRAALDALRSIGSRLGLVRRRRRDARADATRPVPRRRRHRRPARVNRRSPSPANEPMRAPQAAAPRQREILRGVVEEYVATGEPVGSRTLVERSGLTSRRRRCVAELAELERSGCSPTRTPRRGGSRRRRGTATTRASCSPSRSRARRARARAGAPNEVDSALQQTTEMLSGHDAAARARLGAAARGRDRPARRGPPAPAERRDGRRDHVDGGVSKRIFTTREPLDPASSAGRPST